MLLLQEAKKCSNLKISQPIFLLAVLSVFLWINCNKSSTSNEITDNNLDLTDSGFILTSSDIGQDSLLPIEYTCDGESATLPLEWNRYPDNTQYFALIMHHEVSPTDIHWYWTLYNIPASVNSLPKNVSGIGTLGTNSVNGLTEYSPPCSQGPGLKAYTFTIYSLSEKVTTTVNPAEVDRATLLDVIEEITLTSTSITVWYERDI